VELIDCSRRFDNLFKQIDSVLLTVITIQEDHSEREQEGFVDVANIAAGLRRRVAGDCRHVNHID
jgi:hypothetical protein